ncbi:type II toxin-antitoxin system HicB family antitoxin [Geitlerinema sp. P-1104]|uniref:type II toxin-antitoxin system HicB family antitoxin n=1 Tax=Geitlerinema sp. P-1104 TaxID=2546230 RepID=UPI001476F14C|nr:type II toxin-antitoxin system HicB family antitoxin [Geitlerinema sp. P-1104]NMG60979.1 type II toxin-antitoxin system HicB family antitoxin [Geitlerinema sp. P-1104]
MKQSNVINPKTLEYYLSLKYPMSIYPEDEGGYTVMIPDLPGCLSQGETLEEALANLDESRQLWLETVYFSQKRAIPLPSKLQ